ncbi:MAG TPA: hypothetical protein VK550_06025 [Polyangiaceae bacterium]|nr:hypothetical protein [Polyangiaceae bacterium]
MLKRIIAGLSLSLVLVASCSSSESNDPKPFSCDTAQSQCPNDQPPDREECKRILGDPTCGNVFLTFLLCLGAHQTCRADGTTDEMASARECGSQQAAAEKCAGVDGGRD